MAKVVEILKGIDFAPDVGKEKIYEDERQKVVVFKMPAGSEIKPHTNPGVVHLTVLSGRAQILLGEAGERESVAGDTIIYEIGERHGMKAIEDSVLMADIVASTAGGKS